MLTLEMEERETVRLGSRWELPCVVIDSTITLTVLSM